MIYCALVKPKQMIQTPELLDKFNAMGFQKFVNNRHKFTNWRSGVVLTAVSKKIADKCGQKLTSGDLCVCIKLNKHLLKYDKDLVILAVYIPPYKTRYSNVGLFDELNQIIFDVGVDNNYFLICGDMNAHTQERDDFVTVDWDLTEPR